MMTALDYLARPVARRCWPTRPPRFSRKMGSCGLACNLLGMEGWREPRIRPAARQLVQAEGGLGRSGRPSVRPLPRRGSGRRDFSARMKARAPVPWALVAAQASTRTQNADPGSLTLSSAPSPRPSAICAQFWSRRSNCERRASAAGIFQKQRRSLIRAGSQQRRDHRDQNTCCAGNSPPRPCPIPFSALWLTGDRGRRLNRAMRPQPDTAPAVMNVAAQMAHGIIYRHIQRGKGRRPAACLDPVIQFFQRAQGARHSDDMPAACGKLFRQGRANSARRTGNKGDLFLCHACQMPSNLRFCKAIWSGIA